jgi:hypothetical protein
MSAPVFRPAARGDAGTRRSASACDRAGRSGRGCVSGGAGSSGVAPALNRQPRPVRRPRHTGPGRAQLCSGAALCMDASEQVDLVEGETEALDGRLVMIGRGQTFELGVARVREAARV